MRKIYIMQMHTNTIPSLFVKFVTRYKYSHVAISFNENCNYIYSFGRKKIYSILNGGFVMERKDGKFFQKFKNTKCRIYEIDVTDNQYKCLMKTIKFMKKNQDRYKYDYFGMLFRYVGIPITFRNKYVCSYFVAELLELANIYRFSKRTCFVKPRDFDMIDNIRHIYTGKYALYR